MATSLAAYLSSSGSNKGFQQVPGGGGEGLTRAQLLPSANLLPDFSGKRMVAANKEAWSLSHRPQARLE